MSRRQMKPWEVIATLLKANQLRVKDESGGTTGSAVVESAEFGTLRAAIFCPRTMQEITLDNVRTIQVEHWPKRHKHEGEVSPDNAVISLAEGHKEQTKREKKADAKEDRIKRGRKVLVDWEKKNAKRSRKPTGYRWKKKIGQHKPVRVPVYD